jgi:uncharacterized membrane protein (DUF485 family)
VFRKCIEAGIGTGVTYWGWEMSTSGDVLTPREGGWRRPARTTETLDELARRRRRVAAWLTAAMLVVYFTFILLIAFDKTLMGRKLADGLSLGILLGVIVVLVTWTLTWIYVRWANRHYEPAARQLRR